MQRDRLAHPLHNVEGQSQSWGVGIILASRREALHLYRLHVLKDLAVSTPHSWLRGHGEGTDRSDSLMEYRYGSHTGDNLEYHFVWGTKDRYKVLAGAVALCGRELGQ